MDFKLAKGKVLNLYAEYTNGTDCSLYDRISEEDVLQIFSALHSKLPAKDSTLNIAFIYFICKTIRRFDRFDFLRPRDNEELFKKYKMMLRSLKKLEGKKYLFSWGFEMNKILWEVYNKCANKPFDAELKKFVDDKIKDIINIRVYGIDRRTSLEVEKGRRDFLNRINMFISGFITKIKTTLPYKLTHKNSTFHLFINGVEVDVSIENSIKSSPIPNAKFIEDATLDEIGLSKNSYSESIVSLTFHCLIDVQRDSEKVTFSDKEEFSWNSLYDFTYKTVRSIWNYLQSQGDEFITWPPLPQDIGSIEWSIESNGNIIDSGMFTNPSKGFLISSNRRGIQHYDIQNEHPLSWSDNAYYYARLYAKAGQFEEAIFWINVAAEALVDEFLNKIAPNPEKYQEFICDENKFVSAEEILTEQFPDMAGKVRWPQNTAYANVFKKIKRVLKYLNQSNKQINNVIGIYSNINEKRNGLFHGNAKELKPQDLGNVFDSFNQLKSYFAGFESE